MSDEAETREAEEMRKRTITLEDGLSYATNQNNLLLQLKGLSSTEDYANPKGLNPQGLNAKVQPMATPPAPAATSVLDMME